MDQPRVLFGRNIVPHHILNYAEQVYDIIAAEIATGRWKVDDRLPGVINLAKELGFGTKTIQTAYDRLKADGYVRTLGYRGTYVRSTCPRSGKKRGKIGILLAPAQAADPAIVGHKDLISRAARQRNMTAEVIIIPPDLNPEDANRRGLLFGTDCEGVVSLTPIRLSGRQDEGRLPMVFLVAPYESCTPRVSADVRDACHELTCRVIGAGHKNIVFSEDSSGANSRLSAMCLEGFLEAMREHGLPVDRKWIETSRKMENSRTSSVARHLRSIMAVERRKRPTAVVAGSTDRAIALAHVARTEKIDVPEDLSIVTAGGNESCGHEITGMLPNFHRMVDSCFGILEQQQSSGRSDYTGVMLQMDFVPGQTLRIISPTGSPRSGGRVSRREGSFR